MLSSTSENLRIMWGTGMKGNMASIFYSHQSFQNSSNDFSSQLPHNNRFKDGLEYTGLFPDIRAPLPHASSFR